MLTKDQVARYSRHLIMPEVGVRGQEKLLQAKVLCIGAGGLGSPLLSYLAAAGVGTIGIVDFDVVDFSNLQRQIIHREDNIDKNKAESAQERIAELNSECKVIVYKTRFTSENALEIAKDYDIIIDGTDNFATRYLTNDVCVLLGKPNVYGSIFRFEGQLSVFDATKGPCYRCLYPEPPPPGMVPSCAEGGVLGILPGIVGSMQAAEAIKIILGNGEPMYGRLMLMDVLASKYREVKLRKDPECPICGRNPTITELIDYEEFCNASRGGEESVQEIGTDFEVLPEEVKQLIDDKKEFVLLDCRETHEYEICHIDGAKLIPLNSIPERVNELDTADEIITYCHHGMRSMRAMQFLKKVGFGKVKSMRGGIDLWAKNIEPDMPRY